MRVIFINKAVIITEKFHHFKLIMYTKSSCRYSTPIVEKNKLYSNTILLDFILSYRLNTIYSVVTSRVFCAWVYEPQRRALKNLENEMPLCNGIEVSYPEIY